MTTALILNSGMGSRMGELTQAHPKCMTPLFGEETLASLYLKQLANAGIQEVVMTTGYCAQLLEKYCEGLHLPLHIRYVENPRYEETNYIYSMYLAREYLTGDILYLHGDMIFETSVLSAVLRSEKSSVVVSYEAELPQKDFKAVIEHGKIRKIGVEFFDQAVTSQPVYKLLEPDFQKWMASIVTFCEKGSTNCYAENALNEIALECDIRPLDIGAQICGEVDTPQDLEKMKELRTISWEKQFS